MSRATATLGRMGATVCALAFLSVQGFSQQGRPAETPYPPETPYLEVARQIARHLETLERQEAVGASWPVSNRTATRQTGVDAGAAGIGWFYLELYRATGDSDYLATAQKAADWAGQRYRVSQFYGPDWLAGAAGGGAFHLAMFEETKDEDYLDHAVYTADWLIRTSLPSAGGRYWRHGPNVPRLYTGLYHGAAGIGLFLLDVYEHTGNERYLATAIEASRWLERYTVPIGPDAIGWKRLTTDTHAYHHLCGGSTGIMRFLHRLWEVTEHEHYLTLFTRTANGLIRTARADESGVSWAYTSTDLGNAPIVFCHGATSAAAALRVAYEVTNDPRYLLAARDAARWTLGVAQTAGEGESYWAHIHRSQQFETGYRTGTASVGHALLRQHRAEPREEYLDGARAAAAYLLSVADRPAEDQIRWINYPGAPRTGWVQDYRTGWYSGAAGIGMFFLELDAAVRDRRIATFETW